MVKCCVVYCKSGYRNNHDKVTQFSVPKNKELREKWAKAIPRKNFILTEKHYVCSKHFAEQDLIHFWESGSSDQLLVKVSMLHI